MRRSAIIGIAAALLLAAGCGSSAAQENKAAPAAPPALTMRYANPEQADDSLLIERDAAGRVRAEDGGGQIVFIRDGVRYLNWAPPGPGGRITARLDDLVALGEERRARLLETGALQRDETAYAIRDEGEATVGRWRGRRYRLDPEPNGVTLTVTVSNDPALADARALVVSVLDAFEAPMQAMLVFPEQYVRLRAELLGRGTVLSYDRRALTAVEHAPIPTARFELPSPALNREALRARLLR